MTSLKAKVEYIIIQFFHSSAVKLENPHFIFRGIRPIFLGGLIESIFFLNKFEVLWL